MKKYTMVASAVVGLLAAVAVSQQAHAQTHSFTLSADFDNGASTELNNVQLKPADQVVLGPTAVSKTRLVWVSNSYAGPGWIVRIDTTTGKQTARFDSVLLNVNGQPTGAPATGNEPGRVAVDANGDVWIVNRMTSGGQGTLSKFSGDINHCIDRNNNGMIETSRDANGDGIVDPLLKPGAVPDAQVEYYGQADECILTTIKIGTPGGIPRAVAVDKKGKIWVGTYGQGTVYRFNPNEPVALEQTRTFRGAGYPYDAYFYSAATADDYVYFVSNQTWAGPGRVVQIDINDVTKARYVTCANGGSDGTYGIVAVPGTQKAFVGGYSGQGMWMADFGQNPPTCTFKYMASQITAVTLDLNGNVWASGYSTGNVFKLDQNLNVLATCPTGGTSPHGLSVDFDGYIWSVQDGYYHLVRFSPDALGTNCGRTGPHYIDRGGPANNAGINFMPYLYSDFTGVQIDRQAPFARVGFWEGIYDGGAPGIAWQIVSWNNEPQAAIPAETSLKVSARSANTLGELATAPYSPCANNVPMIGMKGRYIQVKSDLAGPGYVTPVLSDVKVQGPCAVVGEACCIKDSDCSDGKPCTMDQCPVPGGTCIHPPTPDCCTSDMDCNDANSCTVDACNGGTCQHIKQQGCCISDAECDDGVPCTADLCSALGGTCSNVSINGCCITNDDCTKGNPCSASTCPGPGQVCNLAFVPGCCQSDDDCKEQPDDLCTNNTCDMNTHTCSQVDIPGCCNKDADCTDADPCTTDQCSGLGGQCIFPLKANCCTPSSPQVGKDCNIPQSPYDKEPCKPGKLVCNNNDLVCEGGVAAEPEKCDWLDNNCDGFVDNASCPQGSTCINGVCAEPCGSPEFPCDPGYSCKGGVCLPIDCAKVICPSGYTCVSGDCVAGDGGVGGAAGSAGSAGSAGAAGTAGDGGVPDASAGSAGTAGAAGSAGGAGAAGSSGTAGASASAGAAGTPGKGGQANFDENYGQTTGGGGCRCSAPGSSSSLGSLGWAAALLGAAIGARFRRRQR